MRVRVFLPMLLIMLVACSRVDERKAASVRAANDLSYRQRYSDITVSLQAAKEALSLSPEGSDGQAEALNNMAYVCYQQMRYDQALYFLRKVRASSRNQLELLCADVLAMKVMQRIGQGKAFFDNRLSAQKRLRRIRSEEERLTPRQQQRLHYALSEFHIVGSTYYYYLGQDAAARSEIQEAAKYVVLEADTTQWLYYHYMLGSGGLTDGTPEAVTLTEFDHLFRVYTLAKANHILYFEANALQSLASMTDDSLRAACIMQQRPDAYAFLRGEHQRWMRDDKLSGRQQFAAAMAHHSVSLFRQYRDLFQTACALRTLGEVHFSAGHYDEALRDFRLALHLASDHSRSPYQVTPWLAGIHENLSLTYSALGNKQQADVHRSTYLDLLDQSRQNRELDSRKALLGQEAQSEQMQFLLLLLLVIIVAVLAVIYYRQLNRRSRSFEQKLQEIAGSEEYREAEQHLQQLVEAGEERQEESREECQVLEQRIQAQQERHVVQRTKLSVVYAIIPYLDRLTLEVRKLCEGDGNASEHLSYIQELADGMTTINDRLTSWIQIRQGKLGLQVTRFPLRDVLDVISMQQSAFAGQCLTLLVPRTDLQVKADKPLTLFMVNTLVDNARKFTPAGGTVSVVLDATDEYVEVSVCDTGIGLSPEDVRTLCDSKVYDPERIGEASGPQSPIKGNKGFGFGIMNCKGIIGSYRKLSSLFNVCDFGVESEQGRGSRFWFRLPRVLSLLLFAFFNLSVQATPQQCRDLYDSTYTANLEGRYADACLFSEKAIRQMEVPVDTPLLVSLYNEQAIAAQALGKWDVYRRSNAECVRLHRLYSTDGSLASDCQRLEKMNEDSHVLYVLIVLLLIASLTLFYMVVLRHRLRHRASLDGLYQRLVSALRSFPANAEELEAELQSVCQSIDRPGLRQSVQQVQQTFAAGLQKVRASEAAIAEAEDKAQRLSFEHDRLYVMNQILDNSLSTIKHETMYFPSRIKQMASGPSPSEEGGYSSLLDLVTYYRNIYMLLYEQAKGQTDQTPPRMQTVAINDLFIHASSAHLLSHVPTEACVVGNRKLLRLFFDQLSRVVPRRAILSAEEKDGIVYVRCDTYNMKVTPEEISTMFTPQTEQLEYLVMRQIAREHDAACGYPGLRLVAESVEWPDFIPPDGFRITFSLLAAKEENK